MNKENMLKVAQFIEDSPEKLNMDYYLKDRGCGTVGCIAGWSYFLKTGKTEDSFDLINEAAEWLGISNWQSKELFNPDNHQIWLKYAEEYGVLGKDFFGNPEISSYADIPAEMVVRVLRELVSGELKFEAEDNED